MNGKILEAISSNHKLVLMLFDGARKHKQAEKWDFRFEASWALDDEYQDVVRGASKKGGNCQVGGVAMESKMSILCNKLKNCPIVLNKWSKNKFGHAYRSLKKLSVQLKALQTNESPRHREEIHKLCEEIDQILEYEDTK
jgi:hypothetical protein